MRIVLTFILITLSLPSLCCVRIRETKTNLSEEDFKSLVEYIDTTYDALDSATAYRRLRVYGRESLLDVFIEYEPHVKIDGANIYYSLKCIGRELQWECGGLSEVRSISYSESDHYIKLVGEITAKEALEVLEFIRQLALNKEDSRDIRGRHERQLRQKDLLKIRTISKNRSRSNPSTNTYSINLDTASCSDHVIVVKRIQCELERCPLSLVSNRVYAGD